MPRSKSSEADLCLIQEVASAGVTVTAYQLERWRGWGLMPRPTIRRLGARGSRAELAPYSGSAAWTLGRLGGRGKSKDFMTRMLVAGFMVPSHRAVTDFLENWLDRLEASWSAKLSTARNRALAQTPEPDELDLAEEISNHYRHNRSERRWLPRIVKDVARNSPKLSVGERYRTARSAMTWMIAEVAGEDLGPDLSALVAGYDDPADAPPAIRRGSRPWLAERDALQTLTWAEFVVALRFRFIAQAAEDHYDGVSKDGIFDIGARINFVTDALRHITHWRWNVHRDPTTPLDDESLSQLTGWMNDRVDECGFALEVPQPPQADATWPAFSAWWYAHD